MLNLPGRTSKPREYGLSMLLDSGLPLELIKGYLELASDHIDYVKLGWGTAIVTQNLKEKIKLYKDYDIPISLGGTFFELSLVQNKLDEMEEFLKEHEINLLEISDGTIELTLEEKLKYIEKYSKNFKVLSEVGSKDIKTVVAPKKWVNEIKSSLNAGVWKVILEGRESGTAGLYRESHEIRTGLIEEILDEVDVKDLIFEAPQKSQQVWFIKEFGQNVNLGNIAFSDIISLETLRLGLRSDTFLTFFGEDKCF